MKAKEFWNHLCTKLGYKFFAGVPCKGSKHLYDKMDSKIMHYVPAVKENVALGLANGVRLSGMKCGVLFEARHIHNLMDELASFNLEYKIPIFMVAFGSTEDISSLLRLYKIPYRTLKSFKDLDFIARKTEITSTPAVCIIEEGVIE